jgi:hypothetical protein
VNGGNVSNVLDENRRHAQWTPARQEHRKRGEDLAHNPKVIDISSMIAMGFDK